MALEPDQLIDRRRLKRQIGAWRIVAVLALVAAGLALVARISDRERADHIARLDIEGILLEDAARDALLETLAGDARVKAVIVHFNSPGGTVVGGEDLFNGLRRLALRKPVAAVLGTVATSAAYMAALGGDRIFAREGTVTGSIGVVMQTANVTGLLQGLGVETEAIKSSPLKAQPSPLEPLTEESRAALKDVVDDFYGFFVDLVAERRSIDRPDAVRLADGRIFTGRQAEAVDLVDAIGDISAARRWLVEKFGLDAEIDIKVVTPERRLAPLLRLLEGLGGKDLISKALTLDGLVSVWHPELR